MAYIDGFVVPVKTARKDEYIAAAHQMTAMYLANGATRCVETWGQDVPFGDRTSFPRAVERAEDESLVFAWMEFPDKATSDAAHKAVWAEPAALAMMEGDLLDGQRMIFAGFETLLDVT